MNLTNPTPPWPRRPPVWSTLALFISLCLGGIYCWAEAVTMPGNQGKLISVYLKSAAWSSLPETPSFRKHPTVRTRLFSMPDGSTLTLGRKRCTGIFAR
jgi:hypothetical protein